MANCNNPDDYGKKFVTKIRNPNSVPAYQVAIGWPSDKTVCLTGIELSAMAASDQAKKPISVASRIRVLLTKYCMVLDPISK